MSNRPIPRKGLLGCWFLDDRGIAYNSGTNEAKDRSGRGNHATYKNGVTVGVEGDPAREFGASGFDGSSNQNLAVGDPLAVGGPQAVVAICKTNVLDSNGHYVFDTYDLVTGYRMGINGLNEFTWFVIDGNGDIQAVDWNGIEEDTYFTAVGFYDGSQVGIYIGDSLVDTNPVSSMNGAVNNAVIGATEEFEQFFDGEIAAVARYDLTVPDAPEPSEIARKWDKLRDIPATR